MKVQELYSNCRRILIVGPYPPPLGGISVFIYRLVKLLQEQKFQVSVFNTAKKYKVFGLKYLLFIKQIIFSNYEVIHIQNLDLKRIIILLIFRPFKRYKILFTDHNPFLFENKNQVIRLINKLLLKRIDELMVVNRHIIENYKMNPAKLKHYRIINTFIAPPLNEREKILHTYPSEIFSFIRDHKPIIIANAYQIKFTDGIDLYGLDLCLNLVLKLVPSFPEIGFIFALANETANKFYLQDIEDAIAQNGLSRNFLFLTGQKELWPLFEKSDLFVRPTYKDGYGISIDEAIYFNCPVIASNACERNPSAIVFENRNIKDLYEKSLSILLKK